MQILNYGRKLSGPLLDRIDMKITVARVPHSDLMADNLQSKKQHLLAKKQIQSALELQRNRYKGSASYNSSLSNRQLRSLAMVSPEAEELLLKAASKLELSARSTFKTLKVARTIADLEACQQVLAAHVSEALQYR